MRIVAIARTTRQKKSDQFAFLTEGKINVTGAKEQVGSFPSKQNKDRSGNNRAAALSILRSSAYEIGPEIITDCAIALMRDHCELYSSWQSIHDATHSEELAFKVLELFGYVESRNGGSEVRSQRVGCTTGG